MPALSLVFRPTVIAPHLVLDAQRRDPTGTSRIIKKFEADLMRRFQRLRGIMWKAVVQDDVFGLAHNKPLFRDESARPGQFVFGRSQDKVKNFMEWLNEMAKLSLLGLEPGTPVQNAGELVWSNVYIKSSYQKGIKDAGQKLRKEGAKVADQWIENALSRPIHADRVGLAYTRTFSDLKGISQVMDTQISRVLAEGLANGEGPLVIARRMSDRIDIGVKRARVIARTEVINAHAQATLNSYDEAGIEGVEVEAEWSTAYDACPKCEEESQKGPFTISEARGLIPFHPNCRCSWSPKVINGTGIELR